MNDYTFATQSTNPPPPPKKKKKPKKHSHKQTNNTWRESSLDRMNSSKVFESLDYRYP